MHICRATVSIFKCEWEDVTQPSFNDSFSQQQSLPNGFKTWHLLLEGVCECVSYFTRKEITLTKSARYVV